MELVGPNSMCQDIEDLYQDVYQLHRLSGRDQCEKATKEHLFREVLDSIKECLWPSSCLYSQREWQQLPADAPQPDPYTEFADVNCSTYEKFTAPNWDSYKEMMALARDVHQWGLVAAEILEERMERMSHSNSHQCSSSCQHSGSHQCRRSGSLGHQKGDHQVTSHCGESKARSEGPQVIPCWRGTIWGHIQSPSPTGQKCQVTLSWRESTLADRREPKTQCWSRDPLAAPTNVADWEGTTQRGQLVKDKGRGWDHAGQRRWRSGKSPSTGNLISNNTWVRRSHPQLAPRQEMACHLCQHQCPMIQSPLPCTNQHG